MRTPFRTIALTCLLALGAAACGQASTTDPAPDQGSNLEPEAILQQASDDLAEQSVQATFSLNGEGGGETFEMTGEVVVDPANELAQMSFEYPGMGGEDGDATMELIVDGETLYMRGAMLPDAGWLKVDAEDAGMGGSFDGSGQMDPSVFLDFLRGADGIEVVGTEDIRGHETTHFSGTIDPAELIAAAPAGEERDQAEELLDGMESELGEVEMTFDAWVDEAGVPWRFSLGFASDEMGGSFAMTFDVLELGGAVEIEVPSGKDVTDLGNLSIPTAA